MILIICFIHKGHMVIPGKSGEPKLINLILSKQALKFLHILQISYRKPGCFREFSSDISCKVINKLVSPLAFILYDFPDSPISMNQSMFSTDYG